MCGECEGRLQRQGLEPIKNDSPVVRGEPACDVGRQRRELGKRDLMMVCREGRGSLGGELTQGTKVQVASMTGQSRCRRRAKVRDTVNPQSACRAGDSRSDLGR